MSDHINAFIEGLPIFVIGMVVVFAMLILLIGFMVLLGKVMSQMTQKKQVVEENVSVQAAKEEVAATEVSSKQDDLELVAVITAAIAASLGTTSDQLQVRSLRKIPRKTL